MFSNGPSIRELNALLLRQRADTGASALESICAPSELAMLREVDGDVTKLRGRTEPVAMNLREKGAAVSAIQALAERGMLSSIRSDWYHPLEGPVVLDLGYLFCQMGGEYGLLEPQIKLNGIDHYLADSPKSAIAGDRFILGSGSNAFLPLVKIADVRSMRGVPISEQMLLMWSGDRFVECAFTLTHGFLALKEGRSFSQQDLLVDNNIETWNKFYGIEYRVVDNAELQLKTWCRELEFPVPEALRDQIVRYLKGEREREDLIYPENRASSTALVSFDSAAYAGRVHGSNPKTPTIPTCTSRWSSHCTELGHALMINEVLASIAKEQGSSKAIIVGPIIGDSCTFTFPYMRAYSAVAGDRGSDRGSERQRQSALPPAPMEQETSAPNPQRKFFGINWPFGRR